MQDYVYLDNYRGFQKALIPISDVCFLVGENSSGKTSLLTAYKSLVSNSLFWHTNDIVNARFSDNVSVNSKNKTSFSVGFIRSEGNETHYSLGVYGNRNGATYLKEVDLGVDNHFVWLKAIKGKSFFQRQMLYNIDGPNIAAFVRSRWEHRPTNKGGFQKVPDDFGDLGYTARNILRQWVSQTSKGHSYNQIRSREHRDVIWSAPVRSKPKRTYDEAFKGRSPEGEHTPYFIRNVVGTAAGKRFISRLNYFGCASGLFRAISINSFGKGSLNPFELHAQIGESGISLHNVGYGVSQSLPVVVDLLTGTPESLYIMQQPEVHLHPRAQAEIGSLIFRETIDTNKRLLIETHSDYLIDRYRMELRLLFSEPKSKSIRSSSILYFKNIDGFNRVTEIPISDKGEILADSCPDYRSFFLNESLKALGI